MTPFEMHTNRSAEWAYIRMKTEQVNTVKNRMVYDYGHLEPGMEILVAIDTSKTPEYFTKRRRQFNCRAIFLGYTNGNAHIRIVDKTFPTLEGKEFVVPVYNIYPS